MKKYYQNIIQKNLDETASKKAQFGLRPVSDLFKMNDTEAKVEKIIDTGTWGFKGPSVSGPLSSVLCYLSFPPPQMFHLGYYALFKEAQAWHDMGAHVLIMISTHEEYAKKLDRDLVEARVHKTKEVIKDFFSDYERLTVATDTDYPDFHDWEILVQSKIPVAKINQLLGHPEEGSSLHHYRIPSLMVTTLLMPGFLKLNFSQVVVPLGINEITYGELAKIISKKLNFYELTTTYKSLIMDITGKNRMSNKRPQQSISMHEEAESLTSKLLRTTTSTVPISDSNQRPDRPLRCNFMKISTIIADTTTANKIYDDCVGGQLCGACKINNSALIKPPQPIS